MKKIIIYGSKSFAIILKDLLAYHNYPFVGYIDDFETERDEVIGNYEFVKEKYSRNEYQILIGIGYNNLEGRWKIYQKIKKDYEIFTFIHKNAYVRNIENIGKGSIIMANVIIDANAMLGELNVCWPGAILNHDSKVESNTFISPNATVCGFVDIGSSCFIGAGAIIVDHVKVESRSFIKAGSIVK